MKKILLWCGKLTQLCEKSNWNNDIYILMMIFLANNNGNNNNNNKRIINTLNNKHSHRNELVTSPPYKSSTDTNTAGYIKKNYKFMCYISTSVWAMQFNGWCIKLHSLYAHANLTQPLLNKPNRNTINFHISIQYFHQSIT